VLGNLGAAENLIKEAQQLAPENVYAYVLLGDVYERRGYNTKLEWDNNKSKKKCSVLNSALSYFRSAVAYFQKGGGEGQYGTYVNNEITRCNNWIKGLEEDKWFYCKDGG
jgi:hypothetical protein